MLSAVVFAALFVVWTYYPHGLPLPTALRLQKAAVTAAPAPAAPAAPVRPRNPVTDITPPTPARIAVAMPRLQSAPRARLASSVLIDVLSRFG